MLLEGVVVADGCHIQNSVVSANCCLAEGAGLKDCQVGPGYAVPAGADLRGEALCAGHHPRR